MKNRLSTPVDIARRATFLIAISQLVACAGPRAVESEVQAFARFAQAPAAQSSWRMERLPSQQALDAQGTQAQGWYARMEAATAKELAALGFRSKPEAQGIAAQYSVQLNARLTRLDGAGLSPMWGFGMGWGLPGRDYVVTGAGQVVPLPMTLPSQSPWYVRELTLLMRDTASGQVVFESTARHEGRWADDAQVIPAMIKSALEGFPNPTQGKRLSSVTLDAPKAPAIAASAAR